MAHFVKIEDGIVVAGVVVGNPDTTDAEGNEVEQVGVDFLNNLYGEESDWKQTSYNTLGGKHYDPETREEDDGVSLRKNYAGIGYTYDEERDAFYPPQPFPSWTLDEDTCHWMPPVPYPDVEVEEGVPLKMYDWNEENQTWDERE